MMVLISGKSTMFRIALPRGGSRARQRQVPTLFALAFPLVILLFVLSVRQGQKLTSDMFIASDIGLLLVPAVACRYHGNCPKGSVCDFNGGTCRRYYSKNIHKKRTYNSRGGITNDTSQHGRCVQTCLEELTMEEGFQYGSIPIVRFTSESQPPIAGCVIHFERRRREESWEDRPTLEFRLDHRYRSVIRIDYAGADHEWMAFCRLPCATDQDCPNGLFCQEGRRGDGDPRQNSTRPQFTQTCQPLQSPISDMIVVSGCGDSYFFGLQNFAASLNFWAPRRKLVVYNLGMSREQLAEVQTWPNVLAIRWPEGIPKYYPNHVRDDLSNYAWKSLLINESIHEFKSIFWFDAGGTFVGPMEPIEEIVQLHGIFLTKGQDVHMKDRSHPATYQWHGYDKETFVSGPSYAGGIQGHVYPSRYIETIVIPNAQCALDPACIAPPSASLQDHRYDQSSLSILAYQSHLQVPSYTEYLAAQLDQLQANLSRPSPPFILFTSRQRCGYYSHLRSQRGWVVVQDG